MAYELALRLLDDRGAPRRFWLIPLQDMLSLGAWIGGFVGREIVWRGERYRILEGGRIMPVIPRRSSRSQI
jgi:ceramide glucosyltransferase